MKGKLKYKGVIVPMITPLNEDLSIDLGAVEKILNTFIEAHVAPFLLGTTGESVSMSYIHKEILVKKVTSFSNKRVMVFAGISGNCLQESIDNAKKYADMGVDALVAHLPFYYPLAPGQMIKYYEELADHAPCPLFLYNNPITTKLSIPLEVIEQLSYHPNIAGLKDSERGIERLDQSIELWNDRKDFAHLVGWAAQSAYALGKGSDGIVPSTGNLIPGLYQELYQAAIRGDSHRANELQEETDRISEWYQKNRDLSRSIPALKTIMSFHGLCAPYVMPPLYMPDEKEQNRIKEIVLAATGS